MWFEFHRGLSVELMDRGHSYSDFARKVGLRDVKLDLKDCDDPIRIAAVALSDLRIGDGGPLDRTVMTAIINFLDAQAVSIRTTTGFDKYIEFDEAPCNNLRECKACVERWYSAS